MPHSRRLASTEFIVSEPTALEIDTEPPDALALYQNGEASPTRSEFASTPASAEDVAQLGIHRVTTGVRAGSSVAVGGAAASGPTTSAPITAQAPRIAGPPPATPGPETAPLDLPHPVAHPPSVTMLCPRVITSTRADIPPCLVEWMTPA